MTANKRLYTAADLRFTTVSECTDQELVRVLDHVGTLDEKRDHEDPESYSGWILRHGRFRKPAELYLLPHQIYVAFDLNGQVAAIGGFTPDDRDVARDEGLRAEDPFYLGFFGGHNVNPLMRGQNIGRLMIRHRLQRVQEFVNQTWRQDGHVYSFLLNPVSGKLLEEVGFKCLGERFIRHSGKNEWLFRRYFTPTAPPKGPVKHCGF